MLQLILTNLSWWGALLGLAAFIGIWIFMFSAATYKNDGELTWEAGVMFIVGAPLSFLPLLGFAFQPIPMLIILGCSLAFMALIGFCAWIASRINTAR